MSLQNGASSSAEHFDILVIGSGEAGKYLAWNLASSGKHVALVERRYIGGSCPCIACLPSKNVIHSANMAHHAAKATSSDFFPAELSRIDMAVVRQRKRDMVQGLVEMHEGRFKASGAELIMGNARFVAQKTVDVELAGGSSRKISAETIIISTGSRQRIDDIPGLKEAEPLTHIELLEVDQVPPHLIILGGGYIGVEFAQAMRRLGSQVTVIERNPRILKHEDEDVSSALADVLKAEAIRFCLSVTVDKVSGNSGKSVTVTGTQSGAPFEVTGTHLLCAGGRIPNTDNLGLEKADVAMTDKGFVQVDKHLRTTNEGTFAVGDCAGSPHFTHIAYDDFRIVRNFLTGETSRSTVDRQIPSVLFTSPELAHIGLSESDARHKGLPYRIFKLPMMAFLRTRTQGETEGFAKALVNADDDTILGFTALGLNAGELLPVVQLAMSARLPYTSIRDLVITHPTMSEGLGYLFSSVAAKY